MNNDGWFLGWILLLIASFIFAPALCSTTEPAEHALRNQGFTNINLTGYKYFACSDSDSFNTGFTATNAQGKNVEGVVCCGFAKKCTVRW